MNKREVLNELKSYGNKATKKVLIKHGAREPFYGVKVGDLKKILKKVKKDYKLSLELYDTGNSDAMYLAGLIGDEEKMTRSDLKKWVKGAYWYMLSEYTIAWITSESKYGYELGLEWIDSDHEMIAAAGWATLSNVVALKPDIELDMKMITNLMHRVEKDIHQAKNRERYAMNGFIIAVGTALTEQAITIGEKIGKIAVNMGETSCKVPFIPDYIKKVASRGNIGKKRKSARC